MSGSLKIIGYICIGLAFYVVIYSGLWIYGTSSNITMGPDGKVMAPKFKMAKLRQSDPYDRSFTFEDDILKSKITVLSVWASWCGYCRRQHKYLMQLARQNRWQMIGVNHKDDPQRAVSYLHTLGNPFQVIGKDRKGYHGWEWGGFTVPETILIDQHGQIIYRHKGAINSMAMNQIIVPTLNKMARKASSNKKAISNTKANSNQTAMAAATKPNLALPEKTENMPALRR